MPKNKFSFVNLMHDEVLKVCEASKSGTVKVKRSELNQAVERVFQKSALASARGERVRFPVIGTLVRKEVKARKAGQGTNPFTGEPMEIKARPASKKPRWSFPKSLRETFANKRNW